MNNIVCSWCDAEMGYNPRLENGKVGHSICPYCVKRMTEDQMWLHLTQLEMREAMEV